MRTGQAQVRSDSFKLETTVVFFFFNNYPGNSQRLLKVFPSDEPESPGSGTLHHYPQRHRCRRLGRFSSQSCVFCVVPQRASSRPSVDDKCRSLRQAPAGLQEGEDPRVPLGTNGFRSSTADKGRDKDRLSARRITMVSKDTFPEI